MSRISKLVLFVSIVLVVILGVYARNTAEENRRLRFVLALEKIKNQDTESNGQTVALNEHPKYCHVYCLTNDCTCGCHGHKPGSRSSGKPCTCTNESK